MNNIEINDKGFIALNDKVMVSDPCYEMNTWCQGVIDNVLKGNYKCTVETSDEGTWGRRVSAIQIVHADYMKKFLEYSNVLEEAVDSGENYRRIFPLLSALKTIHEQQMDGRWKEIVVLHYGY